MSIVRAFGTSGVAPETYNVAAFGAHADGVTDVTSAIHAARDAAGVSGRLYFPPGNYIAAAVTANVAQQTWSFAPGATLTCKAGTGSSSWLLRLGAAGVTVEGGVFDGQNIAAGAMDSMFQMTVAGCTVRRATVINAPGYGIRSVNVGNVRIADCTITNSAYEAIWCANNTGSPSDLYEFHITGNVIDNSAGPTTTSGIGVHGYSTGRWLHRVVVSGNNVRVLRSPTNPNLGIIGLVNCTDFTMVNNVGDGSKIAISVPYAQNGVIAGNTMRGFSQYGIEVPGGSDSVTVSGNTVDGDGLGTDGVNVNGSSTDVSITGNAIRGVSANGVAVSGTAGQTTVSGNQIQISTAAGTGILFSPGSKATASGNQINLTAAANGITANNSAKATVSNNAVYGNAAGLRGVYVLGGSDATIIGNQVYGTVTGAITLDNTSGAGAITNLLCTENALTPSSGSGILKLGAFGTNVRLHDNGQSGELTSASIRQRDTIVLIGTSITAQNNSVPAVTGGAGLTAFTGVDTASSLYLWDAVGFWHWANYMLGQRFLLIADKGTGGDTTTGMLARFAADVVALAPAWVLIEPGPNDIGGSITAATTISNLTAMINQAHAFGIRPIVTTVAPNGTWNTAQKQVMSQVNRWLLQEARALFPGLVVINWTAATIDPTNGGPNTGLFRNDGGAYIHPLNVGAATLGKVLATALTAHLPAVDRLPWDPGDPYNLVTNAFNGGGTTTATGITIDQVAGGAITGTPSKVLRTDGIAGWWQQVTITANTVRMRWDNTDTTAWTAGTDSVYGLIEIQTDNDWVTVKNFNASLEFIDTGGTTLSQAQALSARSGDGDIGYNPGNGVFFIPPPPIPATTTRLRSRVNLNLVSNAGNATFRVGRRLLRKVGT